MSEHNKESKIEYFPDPLAAFNDGCLMDLRFRVAMQFCQSMLSNSNSQDVTATSIAHHALATSLSLFEQGKELGLVDALPDSGELTAAMRRHLEINLNCQLYQQKLAQREQQTQVRPIMNG